MGDTDNNNYVSMLGEFCAKNKIPMPQYEDAEEKGASHVKQFKMSCQVGNLKEIGDFSPKKKDAKQNSAKLMLTRKEELQKQVNPVVTSKTSILEPDEENLIAKMENVTNYKVETLDPGTAKKITQFYKKLQNSEIGTSLKAIDLAKDRKESPSLYEELEKLGQTFGFEVSKKEIYENMEDEGTPYYCSINISDMPANIAFAAADKLDDAVEQAARTAIHYIKLMTNTVKK